MPAPNAVLSKIKDYSNTNWANLFQGFCNVCYYDAPYSYQDLIKQCKLLCCVQATARNSLTSVCKPISLKALYTELYIHESLYAVTFL